MWWKYYYGALGMELPLTPKEFKLFTDPHEYGLSIVKGCRNEDKMFVNALRRSDSTSQQGLFQLGGRRDLLIGAIHMPHPSNT